MHRKVGSQPTLRMVSTGSTSGGPVREDFGMTLFRPLGGEVSLHMDAPPEKVWALVSDVTRIG